jgi:glucose-6-phosphate 1-epimerase
MKGQGSEASAIEHHSFQGQRCIRLALPRGDTVIVALHGAQVLSWQSGGRECLYLSPRALFDGRSAIRGGIPVCFPQFNARGSLPKHGFARNLPWALVAPPQLADGATTSWPEIGQQVCLRLCATEATRALWPHAFEAVLTVSLQPGSLQVALKVDNTDVQPLQFTGALHTYLAVDDIAGARLEGLQGQGYWNAVTDQTGLASGCIGFKSEFDRVYAAAPSALTLHDGPHGLQVAQSASFADTVVWNPGAELCGRLGDMPPHGFARMLCVEAAQVMTPVEVAAGQTWQGWQRLTVL